MRDSSVLGVAVLLGLAVLFVALYLGQFLAWAAGPGSLDLGEFTRAYSPSAFALALAGGARPGWFWPGVVLGVAPVVLLVAGAGVVIARHAPRRSDLGTAKMGTRRGMRAELGRDGLTLARGLRLSEKASSEHVVVMGPTGSGKSSAYFVPNLLLLDAPASVVVSDPKGELCDLTAGRQAALGREVLVFSPLDPGRSVRYNPLSAAPGTSAVRELAQVLLVNGSRAAEVMTGGRHSSPEWVTLSAPLLSAALLRAREIGEPVDDISSALDFLLETPDEQMLGEFQSCSKEAYREYLVYAQALGSERTASSIRVTVSAALQLFNLKEVREVTSGRGFDPASLRERPVALYVQVPERKSAFLSPLVSVFYQQLIDLILDRPGLPVYFLLDEFANTGVIPGFPRLAATARSRKVSLSVGIQGVEQLEAGYGREGAQDIMNNLKVKLCFPGLGDYTAGYVSRLLGQATAEVRGRMYDSSAGGYGDHYSLQRRELLTADEVRRLKKGEVLVVASNCDPLLGRQLRYYEDRKLRVLAGKRAKPVPRPGGTEAPEPAPVGGGDAPPARPADPLDGW